MNILTISRRRHFKLRNDFIQKLYPDANIINCSDERYTSGWKIKAIWWKSHRNHENTQLSYNEDAIIKRCRLLRNIDRDKANQLIKEAFINWKNIVKEQKIDLVYCLPIDSYSLNCLFLVCKDLNIPFISVVGTYMSKRVRVTNFGELNLNKDINKTEADKFAEHFVETTKNKSISPEWLIGVTNNNKRTAIKRFILDSLKPFFFLGYRVIANDRSSFSFPKRELYKYRMFSTFKRMKTFIEIENNAEAQPKKNEKYCFIPLQFYPEITSDYWNRNLELIDHHKVILATVRTMSTKMRVYIKEHPAAFSRRDSAFLQKLYDIDNVHFVKTQSNMNLWLEKAEIIIGNTSTTAINALILNKPYLFIDRPYFYSHFSKCTFLCSLESEEILYKSRLALKNKISETDAAELVSLLYNASFSGSLGGYVPLGERNQSNDVMVSNELRRHFNYVLNER